MQATSLLSPKMRPRSVRRSRSDSQAYHPSFVPLSDDSPPLTADDLGDDPRVQLRLSIIRGRRDHELPEEATLHGVVVTEQYFVRNPHGIGFDRFGDGVPDISDAPWQGFSDARVNLLERVQRAKDHGRRFDALEQHL